MGALEEVGARMLFGAVANSLSEPVDVVWRDALRERHLEGNPAWHTDLGEVEVRVGRDHRPTREVNSLPRQVAAEPSVLALETLHPTLVSGRRREGI